MISSFWSSPSESSEPQSLAGEKDEMTAESNSLDIQPSCSDSEGPVSLEGLLYIRKGRSSGYTSWSWKRRFVFFNFEEGGSIAVYKESPDVAANSDAAEQQATSVLRTVYSRIHRSRSHRDQSKAAGNLEIDITADLPWIAKDVENDPGTFVVEISTAPDGEDLGDSLGHTVLTGYTSGTILSAQLDPDFSDEDIAFASDCDDDDDDDSLTIEDGQGGEILDERNELSTKQDDLIEELNIARSRGKPLRIYFRCDVDTNEKALWLKAFSNFGRLSKDVRTKKSLFSSLTSNMYLGSSRVRSKANERIARDARHLDFTEEPLDTATADLTKCVEILARGGKGTLKDKEFRVLPAYAYPHRWLTKSEMREEMVLPSEHFHDLRVPGCKNKEIGSLHVEVLQCLGLPKLDRGSDTDAVVYLVCGSHAFSTDVICNRTNPMWLRKTRRACTFPLFHGYARLYVGVFDDEPRRVKDDFAGRVAVDIARLRPRSTYDVTLPLRLSTHVYSRRRRGAVRLRFTLNWTSERDALMSYIPKSLRIPLPQHSKPNFETTVMCSDQKAFRNIAITVHGAHLPGRFTFNQMRAAIREINFTRKYIFTALRQTVRETRQWQNPAMSAFVFLSWMHCVFANAFSLVPAYTVLYFLLLLMRNYAKYCTDAPGQRGFIPPSWEELFMALVRGGDPEFHSIEPLELGVRHATLERRKSPESIARSGNDFSQSQYKVTTHKPRGQKLLQALGFVSDRHRDPNEEHLEFPFADGRDYPKFSVRECLVTHGTPALTVSGSCAFDDCGSTIMSGISDGELHRNGVMPRFPIDMDLQRMMRKDSSGTKDFDEEENNFNARRAVLSQGRKAASKMTKTATALSSKTGLDYVVRPIHSGISSGVGHVSSGVGHMSSVASTVTSHVMSMPSGMLRRGSCVPDLSTMPSEMIGHGNFESHDNENFESNMVVSGFVSAYSDSVPRELDSKVAGSLCVVTDAVDRGMQESNSVPSQAEKIDPALVFPEQNIDIQGQSKKGKKLTDDLAEIKDKMHELTWHLFDDHTYVIKNSNAVFFGEAKKPEKWRKSDPSKQIDKYLHMGQYSHSNPFVARVGMYVEPIIGSTYSLLCLFRASFNVVTWRDPILTFWLSLSCGIISFILFFFPWRIFLLVVGIVVVGPQNWAIRILREQGHLPPAPEYASKRRDDSTDIAEMFVDVPVGKPVFTKESRKTGNDPRRPTDLTVDPREIHHVVVPYGPLVHQRCNDWPPEPEYAQVKRNTSFEDARQNVAAAYQIRWNASLVSDQSNESNRIGRLRRRLRRGGPSTSGQGLPPMGPNRNRATSGD